MKMASLGVLLIWSTMVLANGRAQESVRQFKSNGKTIVSQLLPTDRHVEVEINDDPPLLVTPGGAENRTRIEAVVDVCEVIATGRVEEATPRLVARRLLEAPTTSDATANWVMSTVRLRVMRVVKDSTQKVASGSVLEFEQSGGTARIGNITVDAIVPWRLPMTAGRSYLFCQVSDGAGGFLPGLTYEIAANGMLRSIKRRSLSRDPQPPEPPDELELAGAENIIGMLDAEAHNPKRAR